MRRGSLLVLAPMLVGLAVASPERPAAASDRKEASSSRARAKPTSRSSKSSSAKRTSSRERKRSKKRKHREESRVPNRRTATNMPRGWKWPPSKPMVRAGRRCTEALDEAGVEWKPASREGKIVTPVVLRSMEIGGIDYHAVFRRPPFTMDCHLALALVTHSPVLYDLGVRKVNFGSIFRFTKVRVYGKTKNVLSRHALGLAMDVVSFEDGDGNVMNVERDYPTGNLLLLAVEDTLNGSGGFRTVLTPRNDPASHHDHFHIEANIDYYDDERNLASLRPSEPADADAPPTSPAADDVPDWHDAGGGTAASGAQRLP